VVADAFVLALNNGGDWPTWEVLERFDDLIDLTVATQKLLPIGESVSYLFKIAQELETEYLLHLEDDWEAGPGEWYDQAARLLDGGIFQVRLRQADERVLPNHMVSKHPLRWTIWPDGYRTSPDAHYTLNPFGEASPTEVLERGTPEGGPAGAGDLAAHRGSPFA
jgi:hypothetical protein